MAYRSLGSAIRSHIRTLEDERREIEAQLSELEALSEHKAQLDAEIEAAYRSLEGAKGPRRLDVLLPGVGAKSPCRERWDAMDGDARVRFCSRCKQHVYNLSEMTPGEAEALVYQTERRVCVRFLRRADGTVITRECRSGRRTKRRRRVLAAVALAATCAAVIAAGCEEPAEKPAVAQRPPPQAAPVHEYMGGLGGPGLRH